MATQETVTISKEQFDQLLQNLEDFETREQALRQQLHTKGVNERKAFSVLKKMTTEIMDDNGNVDAGKAMALIMDEAKQRQLAGTMVEIKELIQYYEKNTLQVL